MASLQLETTLAVLGDDCRSTKQVALMRLSALTTVFVAALLLPVCVQDGFNPDTNGDGVVSDADDTEAIRRNDLRARKEIRATAPNTELVRGYYTTISDAFSDSLTFSYVHASRDQYTYHHTGMRSGFTEHGRIDVSDGWMRVNHFGSFVGEYYLHPHRLGGRDVLFTEQAWSLWSKSEKLNPSGVLFRLDDDDLGRLFRALPTSRSAFKPKNDDDVGAKSFAGWRRTPAAEEVEPSDAHAP